MKPTISVAMMAHKTGGNQLHQGAGGGDVDASVCIPVSRPSWPSRRPGMLVELPVNFRHHALGVLVHAQHQHGGEHSGNGGADQHAEEYGGGP